MHSTPAKVRRIIYAASTHWDREWYLSYQSFRFRLVNTMDEIIDTLERTPDFARFILDGHAILLEDYLDIRPEMLPRLKKLLAENRIQAGPWLTMPDERLSSGESLISNLQLGFETVRSLGGEPMKCGYLCDIFGHVAQLPQILGGFGVFSALLGRGTNMEDTQALFNWRSPDGSGCVCFKVPEEIGYATFHFDVLAPYLDGRDRDRDNMLKRAAAYVQKEIERSPLPYIFLIDGMDHERIHPDAVELVTKLSEHFGCEAEFGLTDTLLAELNENSGALKTMQGELCQTAKRFVEHHKVVPHTLSSRYDTKLLNDECQTMLERIAWPLATMLELNGKQIPPRYFRLVSGWLAENQTHDSICGCSIDAVCLDVLNRYKQAGNVLREVIDFASKELASLGDQTPEYALGARIPDDFIKTRQIDAPGRARSADILRLTVFNTEPARYAGAVIADIHFPTDYTAKYGEYLPYENQNMFRLFDSAGNEIPYQLLDIKTNSFVSKPQEFYRVKRDRYTIAFQADIPLCRAAGSAKRSPRAQRRHAAHKRPSRRK